jgi:hypothetical protein
MMGVTYMRILLAIFFILSLSIPAMAGSGHYTNGMEGIKCGTIPPEGFYLKTYIAAYKADETRDNHGDKIDMDFDLDVAALALRPIWVTPWKIFGADYTLQGVIPICYTGLNTEGSAGTYKNGLGDIDVGPILLSWHIGRFDIAAGYEIYIPTGKYNKDSAICVGKNFWTHMFSLGGTAYFDEARTWSASILARYETNTKNNDTGSSKTF